MIEISKQDWKLFQEKVPVWQEKYMERLVRKYIDFLESDKPASSNDDYSYTIACVREKKNPVCIALDGMPVMDDVGGIHGYIDFLETIHGDDPQEKEESREWAKFMGWTGRMNKPETVL